MTTSGGATGPSTPAPPDDPVLKILFDLDAERMGVVQAANLIIEALQQMGLVYTMRINVREVGFDPTNRDGAGGCHLEVHLLLSDIAAVGWSWAECAHALCVEIKPGDAAVERFNANLCGGGVPLAPVEAGSIRFGSLSCGHTNCGLRALCAGVASTDPLLARDGFMCLDKVAARDALMGDAAREGLKWTVLKWSVRDRYPRVLGIIQEARNVGGQVARKINEAQGMLTIHSLAKAATGNHEEPDWPKIRRAVLRNKPPWADHIDDIIAFVCAKAGGRERHLLDAYVAFHRRFVDPSKRTLSGDVYAALAALPSNRLAYACAAAAYTCPAREVRHGVCDWIKAPQINRLTLLLRVQDRKGLTETERAHVDELVLAEEVLTAARTQLPAAGFQGNFVADPTMLGLLSHLDINMGRFALKAQGNSKLQFACPHAVAHHFLGELKTAFPALDVDKFKWPAPEKPAETKTAPAERPQAGLRLYEASAAGRTTDGRALLRERGLDVGSVVGKRGEPECWEIKDFKAGVWSTVTLETKRGGADTAEQRCVDMDDFFKEYTQRAANKEVVAHPGFPKCRPVRTEAYEQLYTKSKAVFASTLVAEHVERWHKPSEMVDVYIKPQTHVKATHKAAAGQIVLAPEGLTVKLEGDFKGTDPAGAEISFVPPSRVGACFLQSVATEKCCSAYWCVRATEDQREANMVHATYRVLLACGVDCKAGASAVLPQTWRPAAAAGSAAGSAATAVIDVDAEAAPAGETSVHALVPVLLNGVAVEKGQELRVYRPPPQKRERPLEPITPGKLARKQGQDEVKDSRQSYKSREME